jgi:hypothetical protein
MLKALTYLTKVSMTPENNALGDYGKRKKLWHDQTSAFTIKPTPIADTNDSRTSRFYKKPDTGFRIYDKRAHNIDRLRCVLIRYV